MKKLLLFLIILGSLSLYAHQEPIVRIYFSRVNTKQYYLDSISNFYFTHSNLSYSMSVFQKGDFKNDFDIRDIDSIVFESAQVMKVILPGNIKTYNISEIDSIIFTFNTCTEIQIGNQIWMCKNLDVDHYRNGDSIPEVRDLNEWHQSKTGAWCYFLNDSSNGEIYGRLYNWFAVNDPRGLAPEGWHIPSDSEWVELEHFLGGSGIAGGKMKVKGNIHWHSPNRGATNESGFSALPGGNRVDMFNNLGSKSSFWSSTEDNISVAWTRSLSKDDTNINRSYEYKGIGFSIRCVKSK
jgi:uncharacterized protein (TIGR02145 family)